MHMRYARDNGLLLPDWRDVASYSSAEGWSSNQQQVESNASYRAGWPRSLGMPLDGIRESKALKSICVSLRYRNWVRKGNDSG
jgi:hypothetical protein